MYLLLKMVVFHGYLSLPEGTPSKIKMEPKHTLGKGKSVLGDGSSLISRTTQFPEEIPNVPVSVCIYFIRNHKSLDINLPTLQQCKLTTDFSSPTCCQSDDDTSTKLVAKAPSDSWEKWGGLRNFFGENRRWNYPKDHWTLQWNGLNLYSRGRVLKMTSFEGSGYLGQEILGLFLRKNAGRSGGIIFLRIKSDGGGWASGLSIFNPVFFLRFFLQEHNYLFFCFRSF